MANKRGWEWSKERALQAVQHRLNLINLFESYLKKEFVPLTILDLEIEHEQYPIEYWLYKNGQRIDEMRAYFEHRGTPWQRNRCIEDLRR